MRLENKVAIVTGASSGIGEATAKLFAKEGATVVLAARRKERLDALVDRITAAGGKALAVQADLMLEEDCKKVVDEAIAVYGRIDILVNNAGIADKHIPIDACTTEWWNEVVMMDQTSLFHVSKAALAHMVNNEDGGSIVNISSIGGVFGSAGISYSAAKSAVLGMTKNIAIRFTDQRIRCNAVCPGPTPTELNAPEKMQDFFMEFADRTAKQMNLDLPEATAEDQANAILFFASDDSRSVTGQVLVVDNGSTL